MAYRVTLKFGAFVSEDDAMPGKRGLLAQKKSLCLTSMIQNPRFCGLCYDPNHGDLVGRARISLL